MKVIGFRSDKDGKIIHGNYISESSISAEIFLPANELDEIVEYLNNGIPLLSLTLWLMDGNKNIGPYRILTDGEWIWPSHFSYFVKNGDYRLTKKFVSHIEANKFLVRKLTDKQLININSHLRDMLNI